VSVVQHRQGRGAADVCAGDRGQCDTDGRGPERVVSDAFWSLDAEQLPSGPRLAECGQRGKLRPINDELNSGTKWLRAGLATKRGRAR
jgi:hypothetical protein